MSNKVGHKAVKYTTIQWKFPITTLQTPQKPKGGGIQFNYPSLTAKLSKKYEGITHNFVLLTPVSLSASKFH